jgi:peptidoglycan/xylan/chitin deacetylase (PgdA/CDA1 family)
MQAASLAVLPKIPKNHKMKSSKALHSAAGWLRAGVLAAFLGIAGCATQPQPAPVTPAPQPAAVEAPLSGVVAQNDRFVIYLPGADDTLASLATRFLGNERRQWEIAEFNNISRLQADESVVIPLQPVNPKGITASGYQTVPILCYHRVGPRASPMIMPPDTFAAQMEYLARNNYQVIRLSELVDFLEGKGQLPKRAVVITFDDGHVSSYQHAYPVLRKYGFPATFFLYTDFLDGGDALRWSQIREMAQSGLIDFQSHSKTHANLIVRLPGESEQRYRERLDSEIRIPRDVIQRNLPGKVTHYAYPFGDANEAVLERLAQTGHELGLTVNAGGNPFFAHPLMLRRTMIFGGASLESFRAALQVHRDANLQ